jgi:TolA-binding protein
MKIVILLLCVFSFGCATSRHQKTSALKSPSAKDQKRQSTSLGKAKGPITEAQQHKRDRELVLQRKAEIEKLRPLQAVPSSRSQGKENASLESLSETLLFSELLARYERNDELGFKRHLDVFLKKYPQSARADEALYMAGLSSVGVKNYGLALKYFNQVIQKYPYGSKASMALFAKASVLKKMDFAPVSKSVYEQVITRYPGSPEAMRAKQELEVIR